MAPHIVAVNVDLFNGTFRARLSFGPGMNLISGANGTGKTKLLSYVKQHLGNSAIIEAANPTTGGQAPVPRLQAINPRRNSQRQSVEQIVNRFRSENKNFETALSEFAQQAIDDATFQPYTSLAELFLLTFEQRRMDGSDAIARMNDVVQDFNSVVEQILDTYRIVATWDGVKGRPTIQIAKSASVKIDVDQLSLGEQSILALALHAYCSRDRYDVLLIDEPEVHLNWSLERRLFSYLSWLAEAYHKQLILVTHSRIVFEQALASRTTFLDWSDAGLVVASKVPSERLIRLLAGEAVQLLMLGNFLRPTFFVEDQAHAAAIRAIARSVGIDVATTVCGSSANVASMYRLSKADGGWRNSWFVVDGDNQGNPFPGEGSFIHLDRYCIQNYFVATDIVGELLAIDRADVEQRLLRSIKASSGKLLGQNARFFGFLLDQLTVSDLEPAKLRFLDMSEAFNAFMTELGQRDPQIYLDRYAELAFSKTNRQDYLPRDLLNVLEPLRKPPQEEVVPAASSGGA